MNETFEERLIRYRARTSKDGWKGKGSIAVSNKNWERALRIIEATNSEPFISAGTDNTLFFSYGKSPNPTLDIEFEEEGYIEWYIDYNDNCNFKEGIANDNDIVEIIKDFLM